MTAKLLETWQRNCPVCNRHYGVPVWEGYACPAPCGWEARRPPDPLSSDQSDAYYREVERERLRYQAATEAEALKELRTSERPGCESCSARARGKDDSTFVP